MGEYKVYAHINKINGKRYIGITSKEPKNRWCNGKGYKTQEPFFTDILKYGWDNFEHIILFEGLTMEEARTIEVELIIKYRTWIGFEDCNGYNATINNSGSSPKKVSQYSLDGTFIKEYSSAVAAALENGWGMGSYRHLQNVCSQQPQYKSYHNFLWKYSEDSRDISEWVKRYKIVDNPQKKIIYQYDLNKNFIAKYPSATKGAKIAGGNQANVCAAARGDRPTAYGYIWSYIPLHEEDELKDFTCYDK